MRTVSVIRKKLEKLRESKFREYTATEIGILLWVLGEADSMRKGILLEIKHRAGESK